MKGAMKGFTLIELLLSVGILLILTTQIATYMKGTQNLIEEMKIERNLYHQTLAALHVIDRDIRLAFRRPYHKEKQDEGEPSFFAPASQRNLWPTFLVGTDSKLDFTTLSHVRLYKDSPESELARVFYTLEKTDLIRKKLKYIDEDTTDKEIEELLVSNVKSFKIEYFQDDKSEPWITNWDSETTKEQFNKFPKAIQISLETEQELPHRKKGIVIPTKKVKLKTIIPLLLAQEDPGSPIVTPPPTPTPPPAPTPPTPPPGGP